uniref:Uncharacterized protein n=1 Tax=Arundo donax TaxID=35708 RepID=A0A0A8YV48_ARUDO
MPMRLPSNCHLDHLGTP